MDVNFVSASNVNALQEGYWKRASARLTLELDGNITLSNVTLSNITLSNVTPSNITLSRMEHAGEGRAAPTLHLQACC